MNEEENLREFARRIGMDPLDASIQQGAILAKHLEKCKKCEMIWFIANEIVHKHASEELK